MFPLPLYGTQSVHSLATTRRKSISGYSNTISHVVPWSHTKFLSNYRHNHIWLLIMCALVSFQKVPVLAGCVGAWFLLMYSNRAHLHCASLFFQFMFYCSRCFSLSLSIYYLTLLTLWVRKTGCCCFFYLCIHAARKHILNHLTSRLQTSLSVSLSRPHRKILINCFVFGSSLKQIHCGFTVCIILRA